MRKVIKARILKLRLARGSCHGDLLPSTDEFAVYLNDVDGWLFLYEWDNATPEEMEFQQDDNWSRTEEMCVVFYMAERKYKPKKDREKEEGARTAAAEHTAAVGGGNAEGEGNN